MPARLKWLAIAFMLLAAPIASATGRQRARDEHGRAFLALLDEPLTQDLLYDLLGRLPTEFTHVIIDACHAGGVVGVRGSGFFANEADTRTAPATAAEIEPLLATSPLE